MRAYRLHYAHMNINTYLPDQLAERAKDAEINFSSLLRAAVEDELNRRAAMATTLNEPKVYELDLETANGDRYTGRITGTRLAADRDSEVYLTDDERVILYDAGRSQYWEIDDPEEELRDNLSEEEYMQVMGALGIKPTIDL